VGVSMWRSMIVKSARSLLNRDQHSGDNPAEYDKSATSNGMGSGLCSSGARWRQELKPVHVEGSWHVDRPSKRLINTGSRRLTRSRSSVDHATEHGSENSQSAQMPTMQATTNVLGDVTNITNVAGQSRASKEHRDQVCDPLKLTNVAASVPVVAVGHSPVAHEVGSVDATDPQQVAEYSGDIFRLLRKEECTHLPQANYMDKQMHINSKMRAILVDWLVDVAKKYKLKSETLFLAVALVDRFLEQKVMQRQHLQLVGVTGLLIAAKFEEMCPPQVQDFVYVTDRAYTSDEVLRMEVLMLTTLDFQICQPTALHFLQWLQRTNSCADMNSDLAQYMLELSLVDYKMIRYSPSHLAASAVLLSNKLLHCQPVWSSATARQTDMTEQTLKNCVREFRNILQDAEHSTLQAVKKKFSHAKYNEVAKQHFLKEVGQQII